MKRFFLITCASIAFTLTPVFSPNVYGQWTQKGQDVDGGTVDDRSGYSTSLSSDGNTFAAGSPCSGGAGANPGHVRVFSWDAVTSSWEQKGADINGNSNGDTFGHAVSLSADGNTVAIGSPKHDAVGFDSGSVGIYEWDAGLNSWMQKGTTIDGEAVDDNFGWSVQISDDGNTLVAGARYNSALGWGTGHARVFQWNPNTNSWDQKGNDLDGEAAGANAGYATSISANGNIVAFGAPSMNGIGQAKVYVWNEGMNSWDQLGANIDGVVGDQYFGYSISLNESGYILAIGSRGTCSVGQNAGHTRIYAWKESLGAWEQMGADINGEAPFDFSGFCVSLDGSGRTVAIGAINNDGNGNDSGQARVFDWNTGTNSWTQRGVDIDGEVSGDQFGYSVSISSNGYTVAMGANANDDNGADAGHVRVYEYPSSVGISSLENNLVATIYPNPIVDFITIDLNVLAEVEVDLYDISGRRVFAESMTANGSKLVLDAQELATGTYTIVIRTPEGSYSGSLMKK